MNRPFASMKLLGAASLVLAAVTACSSSSAIPQASGAATLPAAESASAAHASATGTAGGVIAPDKKKKTKTLLYVADGKNNRILVYDATKKKTLKYTITSGVGVPDGITTDKSGNLYVTNNYPCCSVTVYQPGKKRPSETITNDVVNPADVAVDSAGNVFVAENPSSGIGQIVEYLAGQTSPVYVWRSPITPVTLTSLALLSPNSPGSSSIYVAYYTENSQTGSVGNILDCYPGNSTCLNLNYVFGQTGGIAVEESPFMPSAPFDFLLVDQYVPGYYNIANNTQTTTYVTGGTPEFLALNADRTALYLTNRQNGSVTEYAYPGGQVLDTFYPPGQGGGTALYGVAVSPAGTYF